MAARTSLGLLGDLGDHAVAAEQQAGHGCGVLQRGDGDLGRVNDTRLGQVFILAAVGVVAEGALAFLDAVNDQRTADTRVRGDLTARSDQRTAQDVQPRLLVVVLALDPVQRAQAAHQRHAAAWYHARFDGRASRVQRVFDAGLLFLHLGLGCRADVDLRHAASQLGQTLLQLLAVIVGGRDVDLLADHPDARLDVLVVAGAFDDRRVVSVDADLLRAAKLIQFNALQLDAQVLENGLTAGQDRDVLQHGFSAIAEAGRLDGRDFQDAADLVDDQRRQRFAFHFLGDDQQRLAGLAGLLEQRDEFADVADLLLVDQDVGLLHLDDHGVGVGDEVRGEVAAVELHAFDDVHFRGQALAFLNRDDAVLADLLHRVGDLPADFLIAVGGNHGDAVNVLLALDLDGELLDVLDHRLNALLDAAADAHGVGAADDVLQTFQVDGLGQDRRRRGAVAGHVGGLGRDFFDQLRGHVLVGVLELHFLGHRDAVFGDVGGAPGLIKQRVLAAGP